MEVHYEDNADVADLVVVVPRSGSVWFTVLGTEFIVIFIINALTLVAFARSRHLRKRTRYLIMNLTVADLLTGAVTGPLDMRGSYIEGAWRELRLIFPVASQACLSSISLERLHATLYPFRHCLTDKWAYFKIIIGTWLLALFLAVSQMVLRLHNDEGIRQYAVASYTVVTLLVITVSYVIIAIKVKNNPPPQLFGAVASDRKLTVTLFLVTVVSILTILPLVIHNAIPDAIWVNLLSGASSDKIRKTIIALYYTNSAVNPVIYAMRMRTFRNAAKDDICKKSQNSTRVLSVELHAR